MMMWTDGWDKLVILVLPMLSKLYRKNKIHKDVGPSNMITREKPGWIMVKRKVLISGLPCEQPGFISTSTKTLAVQLNPIS
jgi:hypothetical protein